MRRCALLLLSVLLFCGSFRPAEAQRGRYDRKCDRGNNCGGWKGDGREGCGPSTFGEDNGRPFDIAICGGGAGGLKALHYFSQFPDIRVVLLSKGPSNWPGLHDSLGASFFFGTPIQKEYRSVPQEWRNLAGGISQADCTALGGNANLMGCVAARATPELLNTWPQGMRAAEMLQAYKQDEEHFCYDPVWREAKGISEADCIADHGASGPVSISSQVPFSMSQQGKDLRDYVGSISGLMADYNSFQRPRRGIAEESNMRRTVQRGNLNSTKLREDAYTAFFNATVQARRNIFVMTNVQCVSVDDSRNDGFMDTVLYLVNGTYLKSITVRGGVVLSTGVLVTPGILERSGIGRPEVLARYGIKLRANNSDVGEEVHAHMGFGSAWQTKLPCQRNLSFASNNELEWWTNSSLPFSLGVPITGLHSDAQHEVLGCFAANSLEGYANGVTGPFMVSRLLQGSLPDNVDVMGVLSELLDPVTTGTVHIQSQDPSIEPAWDLRWTFANLLASGDALRLIANIQQVREVFNGNNPFAQKHILRELWPGNIYKDQLRSEGYEENSLIPPFNLPFSLYADIRALMDHMHPLYHVGGGVAIGKAANLDGSIKGVRGLYVYDNSAQPNLADANPTLTLWAMGTVVLPKMLQSIRNDLRRR